MYLTAVCMLFFRFSCWFVVFFFPSTGAALLAELEVIKAIGVGRGFAAVVVLGCLKTQLGPYPLNILRPGRAVL